MGWIWFSVGAEYLIKGALLATSGNYRKEPFVGKYCYGTLGDAIEKVKKLMRTFAKQDGSAVDVGQFLKETLGRHPKSGRALLRSK